MARPLTLHTNGGTAERRDQESSDQDALASERIARYV